MMAGLLPPAPNLGIGRHSGAGKVLAYAGETRPYMAGDKITLQKFLLQTHLIRIIIVIQRALRKANGSP